MVRQRLQPNGLACAPCRLSYRVNYECFGDSYMLRFRAAGHDLQADVKLGEDASAKTRAQTLRILDSVKRP